DIGSDYPGVAGVALQPDGKIVVATSTKNAATGTDFGLARFTADDVPDVPDAPPPPHLYDAAAAFAHSHEHYVDFVTKAYRQYLKREPDAAGLGFWVGNMEAGVYRDEQVEAFFLGPGEYINFRFGGSIPVWVNGMYTDLLQRPAHPEEVALWQQVLAGGTPHQAVALAFAATPERERLRGLANYRTLLLPAPHPHQIALSADGG